MITHEKLLQILDYNPLNGIFKWKISTAKNRIQIGDIAGSKDKNGYIHIQIDGKIYQAHILAWFYYYGHWPEHEVDHRNRKGWCNWILDLRHGSHICNMRNKDIQINNTSGIKGVSEHPDGGWSVCIGIKGRKYIGIFPDIYEAACARLAVEQCVGWSGCDSSSSTYLWVKENIQGEKNEGK